VAPVVSPFADLYAFADSLPPVNDIAFRKMAQDREAVESLLRMYRSLMERDDEEAILLLC